ncbi:hypothetical protein BC941DRAFT_434649 [Chlamydoabsidia padenii]|nr:hypothetical protein BC941DRAFT_434649 [Chlamydoabsidia padenii]
MPTVILPSHSSIPTPTNMYQLYSNNNNNSSLAASGIKLAPLIRQATVVSYERRQGKMWFIIHVDPQQHYYDDYSLPLQRHSYTIARRYDDCVQFCQRLYDAFPCLSAQEQGQRIIHQKQHILTYHLPKLKPQGLLNKKQPNGQRRAELDRFVQALFRLPSAISQTMIVLEFFGVQKNDMARQVSRDQENIKQQQPAFMDTKWSHKFNPFNNGLTSFAAHYLRSSTPRKHSEDILPGLTSSNSTVSSISTTPRSSIGPSVSSSFSLESGVRKMKLKVIYDVDNIVVIQIPRSTSLAALRTRLHDKFSTMLDPSLKPLADQFVLLFNGSTLDQHHQHPLVTLISSEQQWASAMKAWDSLEKVTLRCIH